MRPTFQGFVDTSRDAILLIEAVMQGLVQPVVERARTKEFPIHHGDIFIFNKTKTKIKRWTDGMNWGRSRGAGLFFFYYQRHDDHDNGKADQDHDHDKSLVKKTISCQSQVSGDVYHCVSYYDLACIQTLTIPTQCKEFSELVPGPFVIQKSKKKHEEETLFPVERVGLKRPDLGASPLSIISSPFCPTRLAEEASAADQEDAQEEIEKERFDQANEDRGSIDLNLLNTDHFSATTLYLFEFTPAGHASSLGQLGLVNQYQDQVHSSQETMLKTPDLNNIWLPAIKSGDDGSWMRLEESQFWSFQSTPHNKQMEKLQFFDKYQQNHAVKIKTHFSGGQMRIDPLTDVGDLVAAYKSAVAPRFDSTPTDELTLHLPEGFVRSYLEEDCFASIAEHDTTLRTGLALKRLNGLGIDDRNPLLVKSPRLEGEGKTDVNFDWTSLSDLFVTASTFEEISKVVMSDRSYQFNSKPLFLYQNDQFCLEKGRLPDLRFQTINIETKIQKSVIEFMNSNEYLGLLIGPTVCGKSHEMLNSAKNQFTVFVDGQSYPASNEPNDVSVWDLKHSFEDITKTWKGRNQDIPKLRVIAYAFVLSRILFLKYLKEKYSNLTPTQFLIHQLFNSLAIQNCFVHLKSLTMDQLAIIRNQFIDFQCLFCVDEAHVLVAHLGDTIISTMPKEHLQENGDVNEDSKRGTLSVLLHAINYGQFAKKVLFAGTSSKLRNIENFGTFDTKPVAPVVLNQFTAWNYKMALEYVSSFVDISPSAFENVLIDNYRPRILENFVYDLFCMGNNDKDSPITKNSRIENRLDLLEVGDVLKESYEAVIHRFTRVSIEPMAQEIRKHSHTDIMLKLLLSSMMTSNGGPINCNLDQVQAAFFRETIGSIYLIPSDAGGYSLYEGYVIDSFLILFKAELEQFNLWSSLNLLRSPKPDSPKPGRGSVFNAKAIESFESEPSAKSGVVF